MRTNHALYLLGLVALLFLADLSFFVVSEMQQVVITEFGDPKGNPITEAGLCFKPFWRKANYFDKRMLRWDGEAREIPTKDKKFIFVDVTARWRIADPLKFLQSVVDYTGAASRLDDIIDSVVRQSVSENTLIEFVRTGNEITDTIKQEKEAIGEEIDAKDEIMQPVVKGRDKITDDILRRAALKTIGEYGIELIDVLIRRVNYIEDVRQNVYRRMTSERQKIAEKYRSEGQGRRARILGEMERKLKEISSGAYRKAKEIEGLADAEATRIYAESYSEDAEFFAFSRTLETYRDTIGPKTRIILSNDGGYFRYLGETR